MESGERGGKLRTFALGSLVGAAGAIATARRLRPPSRRPRQAPAGLGAFEDAPCFLEIVEREAQGYREHGYREGGEIRSADPNRE
jgi:hypothetical protein